MSQAEALAEIAGFRGVLELLRWAEGREFVRLVYDDEGLPSLEVMRITRGKAELLRVLAQIERHDFCEGASYTIVTAGSLVFPAQRSGKVFEHACSGRREASNIFFNYRGGRREDGSLIMPSLPPEGWYTEKDKNIYEFARDYPDTEKRDG